MPDGMAEERIQTSGLKDRPIPLELPSVLGWKEVPIKENGEPLVALGPFSDNDEIFTDSIYFAERFDSPYIPKPPEGSLITMFVRQSVAEQLKKAQSLFPKRMYLVVFDSYRTLEVQQSLFDVYFKALREQYPDWDNDQLLTETQNYVSLPSTDPTRPSPHNTGGAVDLAIFQLPDDIDLKIQEINQQLSKVGDNWQEAYKLEMRKIALTKQHAQLLNFGTPFDWGGKEAALNHYELKAKEKTLTTNEEEARKNRRLLYDVMTQAGFQPLDSEWWHFNSKKSQMGAKTAGLDHAEFGAVALSQDNRRHEKIRHDHRLGTIRILEGWIRKGPTKISIDPLAEHLRIAKEVADETGDPRITSLPEAAIIKPPKR